MGLTFTSDARPPSNTQLLPNRFIRPAFGELYGFDADADSGGVTPPAIDGFNISTRDTEANILASTPTNPSGEVTIAYGTDTEDLYIWDGSAWYVYNNL